MTHSHNHKQNSNIGIAFFLNFAFTIVELIGGLCTNSIAIISDAVHDFGDSLAIALAWYFQKLSRKQSTSQYTYGYKRFSLLGAIVNSIIIVVGSIYVLAEAVPRLFSPQAVQPEGMFVLAIVGIVANGIAALRTRNGSSINEKVISLHLLEDVLGWTAILIGSIIVYFTNWTIIDPILSVLIAGFVLFNVYKNIKKTLPILMQGTPIEIPQAHIISKLKEIDNVADVHDLHLWALDEEFNVLTMHVVLRTINENTDSTKLLSDSVPQDQWLVFVELKRKIHNILLTEGIQHATIEFEMPNEDCDKAHI